MTMSLLTAIRPEDLCVGCSATAQFHLQNPFGVRWYKMYGEAKHFGWNNFPTDVPVNGGMTCKEYVGINDGVTRTYDHDTLFMYVMSSRDMM